MKRILVDMDGIIVDLHRTMIDDYNAITQAGITKHDMKSWWIEKCVPDQVLGKRILKNLDDEEWWDNLHPISEHAVDYLKGWSKVAEVIIVSAPWGSTASAKFRWVRNHLKGLKYDQLSLVSRKWTVKGDILIDDKFSTLDSYRRHWPDAKLATIKHAYHDNPEEQCPDGTFFAHDYASPDEAWRQLDEFVRSII